MLISVFYRSVLFTSAKYGTFLTPGCVVDIYGALKPYLFPLLDSLGKSVSVRLMPEHPEPGDTVFWC